MAHKTFGKVKTAAEEAVAAEPITFDLGTAEGITCRQSVNGKLLIELVGKVESGRVSEQVDGILSVFSICVLPNDGDNPDEYTGKDPERHSPKELEAAVEDGIEVGIDPSSSLGRLRNTLDDPDTVIDIEELAELVGWLVEQYTSRPNEKSASSSSGTKSTSRTSRRSVRKPGGTTAPLEPVS